MSPRSQEHFEEIRKQSTSRILLAALELFAEEGYDRTSMNKIAAKAGVSKGLIYNYYSSKEELLKAILLSMMEELDIDAFHQDLDKADPKQLLKEVIDYTFDFIEKQPQKMMLITKLALQIGQFDFLDEMVEGKANFYFSLMEKIFQKLGYKDPRGESYILSMIFDGLGLQALSLKEKFWFQECKTAIYKKYEL